MPLFRKKPVVIEAVRWGLDNEAGWPTGPRDEHAADWRAAVATFRLREDARGAFLEIPTLEGVMRADEGDWIIRGVKGEFYPCKPDIFAATYEPALHVVSGEPAAAPLNPKSHPEQP